ncbi:MAG: alpha-amylase [Flammeovirgaceae bacterium]|nr:alpha-amylase [Flammeovirgaceae bacterium]
MLTKRTILFFIPFIFWGCWKKTTDEELNLSTTAMGQYLLNEYPEGKKIVIYQMMTRLFGNKVKTNKKYGTIEENGVGKFNDITDKALSEIYDLGITHVWYTGVIEHAVLTDYQDYNIPLDDADVVKGRAGSPYAIKDYYDINPDLAEEVDNRMEEFEQLITRTHDNKLKVLIDFVPNHVARFYRSDAKPEGIADFGENDNTSVAFDSSNNFYYIPEKSFVVPSGYESLGKENTFPTKNGKFEEFPAKATGNDQFTEQPGINDWFETVKLNYGVDYLNDKQKHFEPTPDTWIKMKDILVYWAEKGVDGFRCDMAEMVPVEFWHWVIPQVKDINSDIIFIAEIYNPDEYENYVNNGKFDFLYDKVQLYDTLKSITKGIGSTNDLPPIWRDLKGMNKHMVRFLENHDEQRVASKDFAGSPEYAKPAMIISATWYSGPVMIYFGQEVGEPGDGTEGFGEDDGRTTIYDYWGVPEHQRWMNDGKFDGALLSNEKTSLREFYKDLLVMTRSNSAFSEGRLFDLHPFNQINSGNYNEKIYAFLRIGKKEKVLVIVNFDKAKGQEISLVIPEDVIPLLGIKEDKNYIMENTLGHNYTIKNLTKKDFVEGINMQIPRHSGYIFRLKN